MSYVIRPNLLLKDDEVSTINSWKGQTVEFVERRMNLLPNIFGNPALQVYTWKGVTTDYYFILSFASGKFFLNVNEREILLIEKIFQFATVLLPKDKSLDVDAIFIDIIKFLGWKLPKNLCVDIIDF